MREWCHARERPGAAGGRRRPTATGLLLGPAAIGYIAEATDLTVGLMVPIALAVFIALAGPITMRRLRKGRVPETAELNAPITAAH